MDKEKRKAIEKVLRKYKRIVKQLDFSEIGTPEAIAEETMILYKEFRERYNDPRRTGVRRSK